MIHNDLPLLLAIPVAWVFDLIDPYTALGALFITLVDTLSMLTYLCHDDDSGVASNQVYELVQQRQRANESHMRAIDSEHDRIADNESLNHSNGTNGSNEFRILPFVEVVQPGDEETKLDDLGFYPSKEKAV